MTSRCTRSSAWWETSWTSASTTPRDLAGAVGLAPVVGSPPSPRASGHTRNRITRPGSGDHHGTSETWAAPSTRLLVASWMNPTRRSWSRFQLGSSGTAMSVS